MTTTEALPHPYHVKLLYQSYLCVLSVLIYQFTNLHQPSTSSFYVSPRLVNLPDLKSDWVGVVTGMPRSALKRHNPGTP